MSCRNTAIRDTAADRTVVCRTRPCRAAESGGGGGTAAAAAASGGVAEDSDTADSGARGCVPLALQQPKFLNTVNELIFYWL